MHLFYAKWVLRSFYHPPSLSNISESPEAEFQKVKLYHHQHADTNRTTDIKPVISRWVKWKARGQRLCGNMLTSLEILIKGRMVPRRDYSYFDAIVMLPSMRYTLGLNLKSTLELIIFVYFNLYIDSWFCQKLDLNNLFVCVTENIVPLYKILLRRN